MRPSVLRAAALAVLLLAAGPAVGARAAGPPPLRARAYELVDAQTGQVLAAKNANEPLAPASTTKIMTALLTVQRGDLGRYVRVSRQAYGIEGSSVYLVPNQRLTIEDLLYGLLLVSGNDAAVELAIAEAGSVPRFVAEMNAEARRLGATGTTFLNPDGLYLPHHLTTAHDLALITRAALSYPAFRRIDAARSFDFPGVPKPYVIWNQNQLLWSYPGAIGVKIGYTIQAHQSIVAAATHGRVTLIAVMLHTDYQHFWSDPTALLNWGFQTFHPQEIVRRGQSFGEGPGGARAVATSGYYWLSGPGLGSAKVSAKVQWPRAWRAGEPVGRIVVDAGSDPLSLIPLVATAPSRTKAGAGALLHPALYALGAVAALGLWRLRPRRRYRLRWRR